jgi:hypothetical protein
VWACASSECVQRDLGKRARQGEAAGGLAGNMADDRQVGEGATRCHARVHLSCAGHDARTVGRGPTPARAYGGVRRGAARGVALWSARARPASRRAETTRGSPV